MSELNINDLPREILIKVFRYLNCANLKKAALTSKLWNNLIESTCRWSLNLRYDRKGRRLLCNGQDCAAAINSIRTTNRRIGMIKIEGNCFGDDGREIFEQHGFYVVQLNLNSCDLNDLNELAELLRLTPNLKEAVLRMVSLHGVDNKQQDQILPDLKKFENLTIADCDQRIIECFRKATLTRMDICEDEHSEHHGPLVDFLSTQETLTTLAVYTDCPSQSVLAEIGKINVPFRLTQLAISDTFEDSSSDHVLKFVESQARDLEELEMAWNIPSSVYKCVFASMPKLSTLGVVVSGIPQDRYFFERQMQNRSVHTLKLLEDHVEPSNDIGFFGNFLEKLPNVRHLILPEIDVGHLHLILLAQQLNHLQSLSIRIVDETSIAAMGCVKFPNLRTLHIQRMRVKFNWNAFTSVHRRLAELTVEAVDEETFLTSEDIDEITSNVDLQLIRLGVGFVADDRFFEIVRSKCRNLKVLDLHKSCISHGSIRSVGVNVLRIRDDIRCAKTFRSILGLEL